MEQEFDNPFMLPKYYYYMFSIKSIISCALFVMVACSNQRESDPQIKNSKAAGTENDSSLKLNSKISKVDTFFERKQLVFKNWLTDTLKILNSTVVGFRNIHQEEKKEIFVTSDSLGLSINSVYDLIIYSNRLIGNNEAKNLLNLLKEYSESPRGTYNLKFKTQYFFTPSPVPELPSDVTLDIQDVQIVQNNGKKTIRYDIIRGRISDKHITTLNKNGYKNEEHIKFLWESGKLIKQKNN